MRWKEKVNQGRALKDEEIDTLGSKALSEYLRAMGVKVARDVQKDKDKLRETAHAALKDRGVHEWARVSEGESAPEAKRSRASE